MNHEKDNESTRIAFTFDDRSLSSLNQIVEDGHFSSKGQAITKALEVYRILQKQAQAGYTDIILRNEITDKERELLIDLN